MAFFLIPVSRVVTYFKTGLIAWAGAFAHQPNGIMVLRGTDLEFGEVVDRQFVPHPSLLVGIHTNSKGTQQGLFWFIPKRQV